MEEIMQEKRIAKSQLEADQRYHEEEHDKIQKLKNTEIAELRRKYKSPFTIPQMLEAASIQNKDVLEYMEHTGQVPDVRDVPSMSSDPQPFDKAPKVFPKYIPGSSCIQKDQTHQYFKKGTRDICAKCGSSRVSKL